MKTYLTFLSLLVLSATACRPPENRADAYGNFEATEVLISSEANGRILFLHIEEGQQVQAGQLVGLVDTVQLHLRKLQLQASIRTIAGKTQDVQPQIEVLKEQKENLIREKERVEALLQANAATTKQLDDLEGQIDVIDRQIEATRSQNNTFNEGLLGEVGPVRIQIRQIEDQISKCYIYNPFEGTVLLKLAEPAEFTAAGKPLYKLADLSNMTLRAYITGAQLPHVSLGQEVEVLIDQDRTSNQSRKGTVSWISDKSEFTPKIVQTKEERVNLVYAVKINVPNDGSLKIGMPGEVIFPNLRAQLNEETSSAH